MKYLSAQFDKQEIYEKEIKPLIEKAWEIADRNDIPFMACACTKVDDEEHTLAKSFNLPGFERTPVEMAVAANLLQANGPDEQAAVCFMGSTAIIAASSGAMNGDGPDAGQEETAASVR